MFGKEHKNHEFEHLSTVYEKHVKKIKEESCGLKNRLKFLVNNMILLESTID